MALTDCYECGKQISDIARSCPSCGAPTKRQAAPQREKWIDTEKSAPKKTKERHVGFGLGLGVFFLPFIFFWFLMRDGYSASSRVISLIWLMIFVGLYFFPDRKAQDTSSLVASYVEREAADTKLKREAAQKAERQAKEFESMTTISPAQLYNAYEANTVAADKQFKGKKLKVVGVVSSINTDFFGKPYVTLSTGVNRFAEPHFSFSEEDLDSLAKLQKGMKITLLCVGNGDFAKNPMSKDCKLM